GSDSRLANRAARPRLRAKPSMARRSRPHGQNPARPPHTRRGIVVWSMVELSCRFAGGEVLKIESASVSLGGASRDFGEFAVAAIAFEELARTLGPPVESACTGTLAEAMAPIAEEDYARTYLESDTLHLYAADP